MNEQDTLSAAIQNLSHKREAISSEAMEAKKELDESRRYGLGYDTDSLLQKRLSLLSEFDYSVKLLSKILKKTQLDELILFLSHPSRVLILNLFIGIMRGIGFALGGLFILFLIYYLKSPVSALNFNAIYTIILSLFK